MRDRIQRGLFFEPEDEIVGEFTCRAACSIGHANKRRLDGLQLQDRGEEILLRFGCFRREKLERNCGFSRSENITCVHGAEWRVLRIKF